MSVVRVHSDSAPAAIGPYAHATIANGFVYTSGQVGVDANRKLAEGGVKGETRQVFLNIIEVLKAAGSSLDKVVKTTVFLRDMKDFAAMNEVYASFFGEHRPARSAFQVARLPGDVAVEIECVALAGATQQSKL